jgi:hypothetical protein
MPFVESFLGLVSAGTTAWYLYRQAKVGNASPLQPTRPGPIGWYGDPVEVPRVQQPVFEQSDAGKIAYVAFLRNALQNIGMTHNQALLFLAHMTREGGWGKAVWNYNFGNIKTGTVLKGPYFWLTDKEGPAKYRAYATAEDGIWDNVELVRNSSRYKTAWAMLLAEDPSWYGELGLSGYYGHYSHANPGAIAPVQREYNDILDSVRRRDQGGDDSSRPAPIPPAPPGTSPVSAADWRHIGIASGLMGAVVYTGAHILFGIPSQPAPSRGRQRRVPRAA